MASSSRSPPRHMQRSRSPRPNAWPNAAPRDIALGCSDPDGAPIRPCMHTHVKDALHPQDRLLRVPSLLGFGVLGARAARRFRRMSLMSTATGLPHGRPLTRTDLAKMPEDGHRYELIDGTLIVKIGRA